jgi:hypothetical protein
MFVTMKPTRGTSSPGGARADGVDSRPSWYKRLTVFSARGSEAGFAIGARENRPMGSDSGRNHADSGSRKFPFEIKSEEI